MQVAKYLGRRYKYPPCWLLVIDVLRDELGLEVENYEADSDSSLAIARRFRVELHNGRHGFKQVDHPEDGCVVLMRKPSYHVGVYHSGSVLHANQDGVSFEPLWQIKDRYRAIEYWVYAGND